MDKSNGYHFAEKILLQAKKLKDTKLVKTNHYRTFATKPACSVLSKAKAFKKLNLKTIDRQ